MMRIARHFGAHRNFLWLSPSGFLAVGAMLLLCVIAASRGISALRETERQPTPTIALGPCIGASAYPDARCGNFEVYENRARQSGRKIALNVAVIPAISKTRAAAPIFLIAGGPGFGVAGEIQGKSRWIDSLRAKNDVVLVDQRGTGASHPLACPGLLAGYKLQDFFDEAGTAFARNLQTCHEQLAQNADVTQYTTPIAMDDLDDVRISLGYDRVILFGMSYGTRAAMVYLHQHPMQVESLILASVDPPASKIPLHVARGTEHALDRLFTDCSADDGCRAAFPNVREELNAVLSRLEKSPATVQASLSSSSGPETMHLTKAMFAVRLELLLTGPDSASRVPYLIHQAAQGDFSEFVKRITQTISSTDSGTGFARGMYMTVMCSEDVPSISDDEMARESSGTMIGTALVEQWRRTCK